MFPSIIFHSFPTLPLSLREKSDVLLCMLCEKRSLPGAENRSSWNRDIPFWEEKKRKKTAYVHWQHQRKLMCVHKRLRKDAKDFSRSPGLCRHQYAEASSEPPKLFSDKPGEIQHTQTRGAGFEKSPNGDSESLLFSHILRVHGMLLHFHVTLFSRERCWGGLQWIVGIYFGLYSKFEQKPIS